MSKQTISDAISRLESMAEDSGDTWDLSQNDQDAIHLVLGEVARLRGVVRECRMAMLDLDPAMAAEQTWEDYCRDTRRLTGEEASE